MTGAVASGHPMAAEAGLEALRRGGSAVDAVLAAAFAQWVVNGPLCGPGGDLVILHVANVDEPDVVTVFGGWSRTPRQFPTGQPVPSDGPRAAVVPGSLAGASAASASAGRLPWASLFAAAVDLAEGHEVTDWMHRSYRGVQAKGHGDALRAFLDRPEVPEAGDVVSCSRFGKTLRRIADAGAEDFYSGHLARSIVAAAQASGGYLEAADLEAMKADVRAGVVHRFDDMTVTLTPPPSQAGIVAELIDAAGPEIDPLSAAYAEMTAPVVERELVNRCVAGVPGTAATVAHDGAGMAAVVHSLAGVQFGTGWVAGETGIAFGNRVGTSLSARPDLPAANPRPGAQLPHTLSAAVFCVGDRTALIATPGGDRQVQWLAQSGQRVRRGVPLTEVASAPRWFVCPEGDRFGVPGGIGREWFLFAEPGMEWREQSSLAGYTVRPVDTVGGGIQAVEHDAEGWSVATDPRAAGAALTGGGADV